jgi:hypothetical protein
VSRIRVQFLVRKVRTWDVNSRRSLAGIGCRTSLFDTSLFAYPKNVHDCVPALPLITFD